MIYDFEVNKDKLRALTAPSGNTGNVNYYECRFTFSDEWEGKAKFATFFNGDATYTEELAANKTKIPYEVLQTSGMVKIGVFCTSGSSAATKIISTNLVDFKVNAGAFREPTEPQPSGWEAFAAEISDYADSAADSASDAADSATAAAASAQDAAEQAEITAHPPIIGDNGNWYLWEDGAYSDSGESSVGIQGEKGDTGEQGIQGVQGIQGIRGERGERGAQGERGLKGEAGAAGATIASASYSGGVLTFTLTDGSTKSVTLPFENTFVHKSGYVDEEITGYKSFLDTTTFMSIHGNEDLELLTIVSKYIGLSGDNVSVSDGDGNTFMAQEDSDVVTKAFLESKIKDELTSDSTTDALSAAQGKALKQTVDTKQNQTLSYHTTLMDTVEGAINEIHDIAVGAGYGLVYNNYQAFVTAFNVDEQPQYRVGTSIYIVNIDVPDLWISHAGSTYTPYTFTTDSQFIEDISEYGQLEVGYYRVALLETQKVNLAEYPKFWQVAKVGSSTPTSSTPADYIGQIYIQQTTPLRVYVCVDSGGSIGTFAWKELVAQDVINSYIDNRWTVSTTAPSTEVSDKTEYRLGTLSTLTLTLPVDASAADSKYESRISFASGATATTVTATGIIFKGDDCNALGSFTPQANTSYELDVKKVSASAVVCRVGSF